VNLVEGKEQGEGFLAEFNVKKKLVLWERCPYYAVEK